MSFFVMVGLLLCIHTPGSSAVTPVFGEKGKDVLLEVKKSVVPKEIDFMSWRLNQSNNLVRIIPGRKPTFFSRRVSVKDFSLILMNLTSADSGVYKARMVGAKEEIIAEYYVTVQDPVSPVELKLDSVFSSSDSCIVNATCSTADSDICSTFRCVHQTCHQPGGEQSKTTNSGASLRISLSSGSISCNHSNQVSWTKDMTKIQDFCQLDPVQESLSICRVKTIVFSVGLVVMVTAVVSVHLMETCKKQK